MPDEQHGSFSNNWQAYTLVFIYGLYIYILHTITFYTYSQGLNVLEVIWYIAMDKATSTIRYSIPWLNL
jgi:hypothetical protein